MDNLIKRAISGALLVTIIYFGITYTYLSFFLLIVFFMLLCIYEYQRMVKINFFELYTIGILLISQETNLININKEIYSALICFSIIINFLRFLYEKNFNTDKIALFSLGILYCIAPFYLSAKVALISYPITKISGFYPQIILFVFVIIWVNDTFAYLSGHFFGKHKLMKHISPKKTIEGLIGGLIFSIIAGGLISYFNQGIVIINWIFLSLTISISGVIGDLIESKFKRIYKIKDTSELIPGHGGFLDRLDSFMFSVPFVYIYLMLLH